MGTYEDLRSRFVRYLQEEDPVPQIGIGRPFEQLLRAIAEIIDDRIGDPYRAPPKEPS